MKKYDSSIHHRKSIRLKEYDYSMSGLYFITICTHNKAYLFAEIIDGESLLNDAGLMIEKWYHKLEDKFSTIQCRELIIMPNHLHGVIEITSNNITDLAGDLYACPNASLGKKEGGEHMCSPQQAKAGTPLYQAIQWFKTMTTNNYIRGVKNNEWRRFEGKLWQRNYWEHVIRSEESYQNIILYINENPIKWDIDELNSGNN